MLMETKMIMIPVHFQIFIVSEGNKKWESKAIHKKLVATIGYNTLNSPRLKAGSRQLIPREYDAIPRRKGIFRIVQRWAKSILFNPYFQKICPAELKNVLRMTNRIALFFVLIISSMLCL